MKQHWLIAAFTLMIVPFSISMVFAQQSSSSFNYIPGSYIPISVSKTYFNYQPQTEPSSSQNEQSTAIQNPPTPVVHQTYEPVISEDGSFLFPYGASLPSIFCAPFHVCEVSLQPGETIQQIDVGDTVRWQVKLARSSQDGVETSHLMIKPTDVGIVSNVIAITDRRTYALQLVSKRDRSWMPKIAFTYPDDVQANWQSYFSQNHTNTVMASTTANSSSLDFKYQLKGGKPAWRPIRVYTDHVKTYIQLPPTAKNDEVPVLLVLGPGSTEQLVNYRLDGNQFIVDKVIERAALISGIGKNQKRVEIIREGS